MDFERDMHLNNSIDIMSINLVEPIFDIQMCDALKYSVMGASTIGHEITHGFDSSGSLYNKIGKKEEWWTPADKQNFAKLQDAMVKNFNQLYYADNLYCNGEATLAENIADLGGLYIAYDAFVKKMKASGISGDELDRQGREFFRGFAYGWMENMSADEIENYKKDEHAANCLRVNGNVYLMDEFYTLSRSQGPHRDLVISDNIKIMSAKGIFSLRSLWFILPHTVLFRLLGIEFLNGAGEGVEPEAGGIALVEEGTAQQFDVAELACGKL